MTRRITEEQWQKALSVLDRGGSYVDAARASDISRQQIASRYPGRGKKRGSEPRITDQQWAVAKSVLNAGFPISEASKYSGISKSTLWRMSPGTPPIYASVPAYYRAKEMLEEEGASYNETEKTTGISSRMLRKHFPDAGWRKSGPEGGAMGAMIRQLDRIEALYA